MSEHLVDIQNLHLSFFTPAGEVKALNDVTIFLDEGEVLGIVGESGSGKSVTASAIMGITADPGRIVSGTVLFNGHNIGELSEKELRSIRGKEVSMIFQDPMTCMNPTTQVGKQVIESVRLHTKMGRREAAEQAVDHLTRVHIPNPKERVKQYPHEFSGGMRQRAMIAMALSCKPKLLIADEPTTALDVTVEAQILDLMKKMCADGTSILLISHNLGAIARVCDDVYVMYAGKIVEHADICTLFDRPAHPYTKGLLNAVSSLRAGGKELDTIPGNVPGLLHLPGGCSFSPRCGCCRPECRERMPELREISPGHSVRCTGWEGGTAE
jgi:oligopeptide/dipeptide ABC transporter ATP-binding protein